MNPWFDLAAAIFGTTGVFLGAAVLIVEHRDSPMLQRVSIGGTALLCFLVAVDGCVSLRSVFFDFSPSPIAVGFSAALSANWFYRLRKHVGIRRMTTL